MTRKFAVFLAWWCYRYPAEPYSIGDPVVVTKMHRAQVLRLGAGGPYQVTDLCGSAQAGADIVICGGRLALALLLLINQSM